MAGSLADFLSQVWQYLDPYRLYRAKGLPNLSEIALFTGHAVLNEYVEAIQFMVPKTIYILYLFNLAKIYMLFQFTTMFGGNSKIM